MPSTPPLPADVFATLPADQHQLLPLLTELLQQALDKTFTAKHTDLPAYQELRHRPLPDQARVALALAAARQAAQARADYDYHIRWELGELQTALHRAALPLTQAEVLRIFAFNGLELGGDDTRTTHLALWNYPAGLLLSQLERLSKKQGLEPASRAFLQQLGDKLAGGSDYAEVARLRAKAQRLLDAADGTTAAASELAPLPTFQFDLGDPFGQALSAFVAGLDPAAPFTRPWLALLRLWQGTIGGPQPSAKQRKALDAATAAVGAAVVRNQGAAWLALLARMPVVSTEHTSTYGGRTSTHTTHDYLGKANELLAKGLVWTLQPLADAELLQQLGVFAGRCFRKVPGRGPLAPGLGNAALQALALGGLAGVAALARVRPQIKQGNTQTLIANYLAEASAKLGVTADELEDMTVPSLGLDADGQCRRELGDYAATLALVGGKAELRWEKAGKLLKSAPAALKASHAAELQELKSAQTQLQQVYQAQRERLDRSFVAERRVAWPWFAQHYLAPGVLAELARPLIWRLHQPDGTYHDARQHPDGQWRDALGQLVPAPAPTTTVQLWHPAQGSVADTLAWRAQLDDAQLRQPLKQAWREVYLLTPPEERTRTYSNRMAAHLLRQHQFSSLAKLRGWRYSLLGAYDKGYESETARLALPAHDLQAEFWVSEVNEDGAWNDTGIWHYVSTDQVRFARRGEAVPLPEIPAVVFSEVMRDVDLFVGVASVGNDPLWRDNGGLPQYRDYWTHFSFGELGEVAKTRRLALQRLLPRLKVGRVSELTDRFLRVQGQRHVYKIHLGSGNILMEPGDRYLCIVPDRSARDPATEVFLPFEGDAVLSIILSKAQLLMHDDQITDPTILRQL